MEFSIHDQNQSKKMTGVIFAILFHVALVWGLINGLGKHLRFAPPKPPIDVTVLTDPKPAEPPRLPLPLKPLDFKPVKIDFVPPVVILTKAQPDTDNPIKVTTAVDPGGKDGGISDLRVPPVVDANACEKPDYPGIELRNGTVGITGLQFLIGADGKVLESKVAHSSGSRALDRAALAGLARCAFKPGTVNGKPVSSWASINYAWKIE